MNRKIIDKVQIWCDWMSFVMTVTMAIDSAISRNYPAIGGWFFAAFCAFSAGMAHGDVRFWRKRYIEELEKNFENEKGESK